ncbi:MAG TPA: hypothetical protein HPP87_04730 [Planctomycetes bacterium]|nr:hypothetical protein [Planctomycetota bacterium]
MLDIETIREAICRHRGGHETTPGDRLRILWRSLPPDLRKKYLADLKPEKKEAKKVKGTDNAAGDKSASKV